MEIDKIDAFKEFTDVEWEAMVNDCFLAWKEKNPDVRGTTYGDLLDWFEKNKNAEPAASLTDPQIGALIRALKIRCEDYGLWYALQRDLEDPWDYGFMNFGDALMEANRVGIDFISIIDISKTDPICLEVLHRGEDF